MIYVAFVSHDDELEMVPLGWAGTVKEACQLCRQHAIDNEDGIAVFEWEDADHSRIKGEFLTVKVKNDCNETFKYYVRPVEFPVEIIEPQERQRPPLLPHCREIHRNYEAYSQAHEDGGSLRHFALRLCMSEASLNQHLAIAELPNKLRDRLRHSASAMQMVTELERRMSLDPKDSQAIPFVHARELACQLGPMQNDAVMVALRVLVAFRDGKATAHPTLGYLIFRGLLDELRKA